MTVTIEFAAPTIDEIKATCALEPRDALRFAPSDMSDTPNGIYVEITQKRGHGSDLTYKCMDVVLRLDAAIALHEALDKLIKQQLEI